MTLSLGFKNSFKRLSSYEPDSVTAQISIILLCRLADVGYLLWATLKIQHHRSSVLHKSRCVCWDKNRSNTLQLTYSTYSLFYYYYFSLLAVRSLNDQLMFLERAFIDPLGLPGRPFYRWERFTFHSPPAVVYENSFKI